MNIASDHDHDCIVMFILNLTKHIETGTIRQVDIEQNCGGNVSVEKLGTFSNRSGFNRREPPTLQGFFQRPSDSLVVIDDEYFFSRVPGGHQSPSPCKRLSGSVFIIGGVEQLRKLSSERFGSCIRQQVAQLCKFPLFVRAFTMRLTVCKRYERFV